MALASVSVLHGAVSHCKGFWVLIFRPWCSMCYIFILSSAIEVILIELTLLLHSVSGFYKPFVASNQTVVADLYLPEAAFTSCQKLETNRMMKLSFPNPRWGCKVNFCGDSSLEQAWQRKPTSKDLLQLMSLLKHFCNSWCQKGDIRPHGVLVQLPPGGRPVRFFPSFQCCVMSAWQRFSLGRDQQTSLMQQQNCYDLRTKGASGVCGTNFGVKKVEKYQKQELFFPKICNSVECFLQNVFTLLHLEKVQQPKLALYQIQIVADCFV